MEKTWKVTLEQNLKKHYVYSTAMSARGAELEAKKMYPNATVLRIERQNAQKRTTRQPKRLDKINKNLPAKKKNSPDPLRGHGENFFFTSTGSC